MLNKYASIPLIIISFSLVSCDDPQLVKKKGEQEVEIARLAGELKIAEEKLQQLPQDRTEDLKLAVETNHQLETERQKLLEEIEKIEAEEEALTEQFNAYKAEYSIDRVKPLEQ